MYTHMHTHTYHTQEKLDAQAWSDLGASSLLLPPRCSGRRSRDEANLVCPEAHLQHPSFRVRLKIIMLY